MSHQKHKRKELQVRGAVVVWSRVLSCGVVRWCGGLWIDLREWHKRDDDPSASRRHKHSVHP